MKVFKYLMLFASFSIFSLEIFSCNKCKHEYETTYFEGSCTTDEYNVKKCNKCGDEEREIISLHKGHTYGEWSDVIIASVDTQGLQTRTCSTCGYIEEKILPPTEFKNVDVLQISVSETKIYECTKELQAQLIFDKAVFDRKKTVILYCKYDYNSKYTLLNTLMNNCSVNTNFSCNMKVYPEILTGNCFIFYLYYGTPLKTTSKEYTYEQYNSLNYQEYESERTEEFYKFKGYEEAEYSCNVDYSDQYVYVLERGLVPHVRVDSSIDKVNTELRSVLREIIDDKMSDFDKIKAIHDWLVLNVQYDNQLYQKALTNFEELKDYNGFYLEGVFLDHVAVCDGISKAFAAMCNIEGIPCVYVDGKFKDSNSNIGHAWNKVYLEGKWYVVDVTNDGILYNGKCELLSYEYFLVSSSKFSNRFEEYRHINLICDSDYDVFKKMSIYSNGYQYDCCIENKRELKEIIEAFESSEQTNITIQVYIAYNYGSSIIDDLQDSYAQANLSPEFYHLMNNNILTLIK